MEFFIFRKIIQGKLLTALNFENLILFAVSPRSQVLLIFTDQARNGWCDHLQTDRKAIEALCRKLFLSILVLS